MYFLVFGFSSRRRHTRCALVTGVQTCALPICVTAVFLSMDGRESRRRWAPVLGLLGQPGWFVAAVHAHQLGVLLVAVLYTLAWCRGLWTYWRPSAIVAAREAI